ncbi:MAG: aminotransferase class V-fold PLP-dependent enzyme [Planctomycetes bacterium]|nr:aminotransferase class V-fold PLP-dependent enzyme [Planctomycetota bacterium]
MHAANELPCRRDLFFLEPEDHYLNCAYMAPLSRAVEAAGEAGLRRRRRPFEIRPQDFFTTSEHVRAAFARVIGAREPQRVAILPSVSYGIAIAARNLPLAAGQTVVIAAEQFPSNVYAWREAARRAQAELVTVAAPETQGSRAEAWNDALLRAIDARTAVVALPHTHWVDGTRFELERIGARARAHGASLVIDGTQSVGALPFDLEAIRPEALVCAAYKWLLGPYGLAYGWFGPRFDAGEPLEWNWIAREGSEDFRSLLAYRDALAPGAVRYDVGERSDFVRLPMALAALELVHELGAERIQRYAARLIEPALEEARALGFRCEESAGRGAHLIGLRADPPLDAERVQSILREERVHLSQRGEVLRVSPHVYNDAGDAAALMRALRRLAS